jgi:hypothetical protein
MEYAIVKIIFNIKYLLGCGRYCTSCNLRTGCEDCIPENIGNVGWVVAPLT